MKRKIKIIALLLSSFLLVSCFEFVEEVSFNEDGSGNVVLTLNLSKSKTKLASIMLLDSINGYKVPSKEKIRQQVNKALVKVKKLKGVSNVQSNLNFKEFIVTVSCDFDNVDVLNTVIASFSSKKDAMSIKKHKHFTYNKNKKTFIRSHHFDFSKEIKKAKEKDKAILKDASYTSIYRFKSPVKKFQNKDCRISKTKKALMLRASIQDIITNNKSIKNHIELE
ncbi:hypothetical protein [uncultured Tenacibaculum sp.]|uniref:hypothetical protein n=1 Tax=uncultured Tenacibaculum sp. TaxID=174713 RepID=UPI002633B996|nr:hypothetical protein [uncultured Tenacibaculum sp.]